MGFDSRPNVKRTADAQSYTATVSVGTNVFRADITYKPTFKIGPPSITATSMDALMSALTKLDNTVKFYLTDPDANVLSAQDAAVLEAMRADTGNVSDVKYFAACRKFGQQPSVRPNTATVASKAQPIVNFVQSANAWQDFEQAHGELWVRPFGDTNLKTILQFLEDEQMQVTAPNLEQAYRELKAANCFRMATVLTRGMNGSFTIVQPYSHARILALRKQQTAEAAFAAPAGLSEVDKEAWEAVHAKYPKLSVNSQEFKQCCSNTILLWAREYVLESQPGLASANKKGELRAAIDNVVAQWTRNPNIGQGQKTIKDQRVWLG